MLPLPAFELHRPSSLAEALSLLETLGPGAVLIAGGTDLLPNMKQGLLAPRDVVSLANVAGLGGIARGAETVTIGAMASLDSVAVARSVRADAPALAEAALSVGGPHHRRMGTFGGNLCLDTRCRYYNQSWFWRSALGFCLKKDGTTCHVVGGGRRCVAAASNDTAAAMIALDGTISLVGPRGTRDVAARDFYVADGIHNTVRAPDEILVSARIPVVPGRRSAYEKLRRRGAIDFPLLSIAVRADVVDGVVESAAIVVSALAAKPRIVEIPAGELGKPPGEVRAGALAEAAYRACTPLPNVDDDVAWRREMVRVLVRRALARIEIDAA